MTPLQAPRNRGIALIAAVAVVSLGAVLLSMFVAAGAREQIATTDRLASTQTLFVAQAGLEYALHDGEAPPGAVPFAGGSFAVGDGAGSFTSTGTFRDSTRVLEAAPPPDLLVHYPLDEGAGATAFDASGAGRDALLAGSPVWEPAHAGTGLRFDRGGDRLEDADAEAYLEGLDALTIALWLRADKVGETRGILDTRDGDPDDDHLLLRSDETGPGGGAADVLVAALATTAGTTVIESSAGAQTTEWRHVAITWSSGGTLAMHLDGAPDLPSHLGPAIGGTVARVETLVFGITAAKELRGVVDEVRIYDRVLTPVEIAVLASM